MRLKAPKGCGSVSFDGKSYPVVEGVVEVPDEAAAEFTQPGWGFTPTHLKDPEDFGTKTEKAKGPQAGTPAPRK
jgi:hypothetical protein